MALNWQHIKGVNGSENALLYTSLEFGTGTLDTSLDYHFLPQIYMANENFSTDYVAKTNFGYILTSNAMGQWAQDLHIDKSYIKNIYQAADRITFRASPTSNAPAFIDGGIWQVSPSSFIIGRSGQTVPDQFTNYAKTKFDYTSSSTTIKTIPTINNCDFQVTGVSYFNKSLKSSGAIHALYFNATSDRRAKRDIQPFCGDALKIINQLQTYTYTYKDTGVKSYGIMAQDMLDFTINDFSFVDNKTATGVDNDYMSIHESKLVYLLIEGIKEQQKEINQLRTEIEVLKNGK